MAIFYDNVTQEFENISRNPCDSEDDLPPFPVQQDYSPTGYPNSVPISDDEPNHPSLPLAPTEHASCSNVYIVQNETLNQTASNQYKSTPPNLPPSRSSSQKSLQSLQSEQYTKLKLTATNSDSQLSKRGDFRKESLFPQIAVNSVGPASDSIYHKLMIELAQKQNISREKINGNNNFNSFAETKNVPKKRPVPLPKPPQELTRKVSEAHSPYLKDSNVPSPNTSNSDAKTPTRVTFYFNTRESTDGVTSKTFRDSLSKKKYSLGQLPATKSDDDLQPSIKNYLPLPKFPDMGARKSSDCESQHADYENIRFSKMNIPDDVKVKLYDNYPDMAGYVSMDRHNRRKSTSDVNPVNVHTEENSTLGIYATMNSQIRHEIKSQFKLTHSSIESNRSSFHIKGEEGCLYAAESPSYIYDLNPNCVRGDEPPFIRSKQKIYAPPCFCPRNCYHNKPPSDKEEVFYSCEDIYVDFDEKDTNNSIVENEYVSSKDLDIKNTDNVVNILNDENYVLERFGNSQTDDSSKKGHLRRREKSQSIFRKKLKQIKSVFVDWNV